MQTTNEVLAFARGADGALGAGPRYATGGRGTGKPHLPSQSSIVLGGDGGWLLVANAGSDDVTLFAVDDAGLTLADRVGSGGSTPTSVAVHGDLVYVLNNGSASVTGFRIDGGRLAPIAGSARPLSSPDADGAQVAFSPDGQTLVVTERGTNSITQLRGRRRRDARRRLDDPVAGRDAVRVRLLRRRPRRHRGVRRHGGRGGRLLVHASPSRVGSRR